MGKLSGFMHDVWTMIASKCTDICDIEEKGTASLLYKFVQLPPRKSQLPPTRAARNYKLLRWNDNMCQPYTHANAFCIHLGNSFVHLGKAYLGRKYYCKNTDILRLTPCLMSASTAVSSSDLCPVLIGAYYVHCAIFFKFCSYWICCYITVFVLINSHSLITSTCTTYNKYLGL